MGACPACGASTDVGDRYCAGCGEALAAPFTPADGGFESVAGEAPAALDEPELLLADTTSSRAAADDSRPLRRRPSRGIWVAAVLGIVVVGIAVWAIGRAGPDSAAPGDDAATADSVPATTTTESTATEEETADDTSTADTATDETTADDAPTVATYDPDDPADVGPVLGREVGWALIGGSRFTPGVVRIDLDTGDQVRFDDVTGAPILALDGTLVLQQDEDDGGTALRLVPVGDPTADGASIAVDTMGSWGDLPLFPAGDGGVWVYNSTVEATTWRLVRLRDGREIDELPAPPANQVLPLSGGGPFVVTSSAGGLYHRDGDGFRLVSPGSPITVNQDAALVELCTSPAACQLQWVDVDSGQAVDRVLPPVDGVAGWARTADPAGRFLVGWREDDGPDGFEIVLYDLERQRLVNPGTGWGNGLLAASPDGRYLAFADTDADAIRIYDVVEDRMVAVSLSGDSIDNVVFVPNGAG